MNTELSHEVTRLLRDWQGGDSAALEKLTPLVYDELRRLAAHYLRGERKGHTLQGTALVHEAFVRLVGQERPEWQGRAHFFGVVARLMRQILVDHARRHTADKRGGGLEHLSLEVAAALTPQRTAGLLALDEALEGLAKFDERKSRYVDLRYFCGLGVEEIGEVEGVATATVRRQLRTAEAWLHREMTGRGKE